MQKNVASPSFSPRTLHQQILRHLGMRIVRGDVQAGETLPSEPELCAQLNVSRIALREALKVLAAKGLVESRPKTGTLVRARSTWNLLDPAVLSWLQEVGPDEAFLRDLSDVRLVIEPAAARRAARHATDAEIGALEAWYRRMEIAIHDVDTFIRADLDFHEMILTGAHNELLQQLGKTIRVALRASRAITTRLPGASEGAMPLHRAVLDAIRNHNEQAAEQAMIDLIMAAQSDIDHVLHPDAD
jgi:GntR family galactonate operon transcriptional repressor